MAMSKSLTLYRWWITDPRTGKTRATLYRMSDANARLLYPEVRPVEGSKEVRVLPDDLEADSTSAWQRRPS